MELLVTTNDQIRVITGGSQSIDCCASWVDTLAGVQTAGTTDTNIASTVASPGTTVVDHPASSTARNIKKLSIHNNDATASIALTVCRVNSGTTVYKCYSFTLLAGQTWTFTDQAGAIVSDASGGRVETPLTGRFLNRTLVTSASANFTTGPSTNTIFVRGVAGGGQGGGNAATAGTNGSGGGGGSYAEKTFAVSPNTAYAYTCGAGGSTGGTNANGQAGANSTFVVGGTTVTCNGGGGGVVGAALAVAVIGGAGGALSTNGDLNAAGQPGHASSNGAAAADNVSGAGGSSVFGGGANGIAEATNTTGSSAAALGYGGGGGGSATSATTARAGGAGAPGCWIVEEYS